MVCWYCYWGWPKQVADIYNEALRKLGGYDAPLKFGPGHIVWEDENFDMAESCLKNLKVNRHDFTDAELEIVRESLLALSELPIGIRCPEPDDYNGTNHENFPPDNGVIMERI